MIVGAGAIVALFSNDDWAMSKDDLTLKIIDTIFAGDNNTKLLEKNSCIKIMTGARIPQNATAIIPKEDTEELNDNKIKIIQKVNKFQHIRYIGEDIKKDEVLVKIGEEINFSFTNCSTTASPIPSAALRRNSPANTPRCCYAAPPRPAPARPASRTTLYPTTPSSASTAATPTASR